MSSNNRIKAAFSKAGNRSALIPYVTAGDPSVTSTPKLMHELVSAGADIIELGVPFSDPMADGPVIQRAAQRAIERGTTLKTVFEMVSRFRQQDSATPVVLMGYANPVERMGQDIFAKEAGRAGVDGVLIVDYPPEEAEDFANLLINENIDPIFLLAPTSTSERIQKIAKIARGYVYYVSLKGVTGAATLNTIDVQKRLETIRKYVSVPVGVGFGVRDANSAKQLAECADAVVIGSKLIETMESAYTEAKQRGAAEADCDKAAIDAVSKLLRGIREVL